MPKRYSQSLINAFLELVQRAENIQGFKDDLEYFFLGRYRHGFKLIAKGIASTADYSILVCCLLCQTWMFGFHIF